MTANGQASGPPGQIDLPTPPPLSPSRRDLEDTNTLAILLPHQDLFAPRALALLRDAFEGYGALAHWAPVRAMGRVIAVYEEDSSARAAKEGGDGLRLDVDLEEERERQEKTREAQGEGYFGHSRKNSRSKGLVIRVYALPPTNLSLEKDHLRPPAAEKNFLISPPGSPPEGWEPIVEEGPNMAPLADDLRRALEALSLAGRGRRGGGPEVILDEGGVRVEVEDTERKEAEGEEWESGQMENWGEEQVQGGPDIWAAPTQSVRIAPTGLPGIPHTAMPPRTARPPV